MNEAIGQVVPLALGVSLSPVPIIGVVLMLATPRARQNALSFLAGWIGGISVVGTIVMLVSSGAGASSDSGPATWVSALELVLGVSLVALATRQWRGRPSAGEEAPMPAWMKTIDGFKAPKAVGLAVLLSSINPKNLLLVVAAAAAISQTGISSSQQAGSYAIFIILATIGPGAPVAIYFAMGDRSKKILDGLRGWMAHNNAVIMGVICLLLGAKLIGNAIAGF